MSTQGIAQMAHLMRRAGFGATRDELETYVAKGYEATVEELLHPENAPPSLEDEDVVRRYHADQNSLHLLESCQAYWLYRMVNTRRPLEEKMALFWHGIFATGYTKLNHPKAIPQAGRHVPEVRSGKLPHPAFAAVQGPGHDLLAGQQGQPRERRE